MNDCCSTTAKNNSVFCRYATQERVTQMHRCKNPVKDEINSLVYKIRHYFQVRTFALYKWLVECL